MTDLNSLKHITLIDGLMGYLEIREWALQKLHTTKPLGVQVHDFRMHHYLYFVNLFGAVDYMRDSLNQAENGLFDRAVRDGFSKPDDYDYARALRNAVVHRGFDPTTQGGERDGILVAWCPAVVPGGRGKKTANYVCSLPALVDLAAACNQATNSALLAALEQERLLDPAVATMTVDQVRSALDQATHMPSWAREMTYTWFSTTDTQPLLNEMARSRADRLLALLGRERRKDGSTEA